MKFLLPVGGVVDHEFGILTNYAHKAVPLGIKNGMDWGGDVPIYNSDFEPAKWLPWIETMLAYRDTCLFMTCPDVIGDAQATIAHYNYWRPYLNGWPVAFVAQDGQEDLDFPDPRMWDTLFVGGLTQWKKSMQAVTVIRRAQQLNKQIHIGRVNWGERYRLFRVLKDSDNWTCDGTRPRYEGIEKTIMAWRKYQDQPPLFTI